MWYNLDYRLDAGVSTYNNEEFLHKFSAWIEEDRVFVNTEEIIAWQEEYPQPGI